MSEIPPEFNLNSPFIDETSRSESSGSSRSGSTDLDERVNEVGLKVIQAGSNLASKVRGFLASHGFRYIKLTTEDNKTVYVRINHIVEKLEWTKEEVKETFKGGSGFAKLQEAFALRKMIDSKETESELQSIEEEGRGAIIDKEEPRMADVISSYKDKLCDIKEVAIRCLNALKYENKSVFIGYATKATKSSLASVIIIDPKKLTIQIGSHKGEGSSGHIFDVEGVAVKVHALSIFQSFAVGKANEELKKEVTILKKIGLYEGIQKIKGKEEVHEIRYLMSSFEANEGVGKLCITESYLYNGNAVGFIKEHSKDDDYKKNVLSMQLIIMDAYDHMHDKDCFHLDGKPENYYYKIDEGKVICDIGDFGSAIAIEMDGKMEVPENFEGTRLYTPPALFEDYNRQARKTNKLIDEKAPESEILEAKKDCATILKKVDDFQKAVTFYQMSVKDKEKFPYNIESFGVSPQKVVAERY